MLKSRKGLKRATVIALPHPVDLGKLEEAIDKLAFRELGPNQEKRWGFIKPDHSNTWPLMPVCGGGNLVVLTVRFDRRVPNKSRLSRQWHEAIQEKEKKEERKLNKAERGELREEIKKQLLAKTPPQENVHQAIYDANRQHLVVLESSDSKVEFVAECVNRALDHQGLSVSYDAKNIERALEETLTAWLWRSESLPQEFGFEVGADMRLENQTCKAVLANQEADSEEVRAHLNHQKLVQQLDLVWNEQVSLALSSKRVLRKMDFKEFCADQIKEIQEDGSQEELRTYQQAVLLVFYNAFLELWDAVNKIPTQL